MAELRADSPIQFIKGVGPVRAAQFAELGLHTVADLLHYLPFRYEEELGEVAIADLRPDTLATVRGEVRRVRGRWPMFTAEIEDGTGCCRLQWFDQRYSRPAMYVGVTVVAAGKVQMYQGRMQLVHPRVTVYEPRADLPPRRRGAQLVGVYRGSEKLKSTVIRQAVLGVLAAERLPMEDTLPAALRVRHGLWTLEKALRELHVPEDEEAVRKGRRRLAYGEFLLLELGLAIRRRRLVSLREARPLAITAEIDRRIRARFPFKLTAAQDDALREIVRDLKQARPMTRLLQGDVGSGKTVVALYACLLAVAQRRQAAMLAPTEVLAQQHFRNVAQYLAGSRVRYALLTGALPRAEREQVRGRLAAGEIDLVIGTHALIEEDVAFADLALVVVDEQHKFGVLQRAEMRTKGPVPHFLVMTATPIPRTLAMTVFGDLDVSVLRGAPPGRGRVTTRILPGRRLEGLLNELRPRLMAGEQAYVVCPLIGESGEGAEPSAAALTSVRQMHERVTQGAWRGVPVGVVHGRMASAEKDATIRAFAGGELRALIATTVVEVGVDVPGATIMLVDHAERFGLSQLHQLRGRIGRGERNGECFLVAHGRGEQARARLEALVETTDGFRIAEADLRLRGPGELLGTRQHGLPELRFGDLITDFELLERAREDAFAIVERDPRLAEPGHQKLVPALRELFGEKLRVVDAG